MQRDDFRRIANRYSRTSLLGLVGIFLAVLAFLTPQIAFEDDLNRFLLDRFPETAEAIRAATFMPVIGIIAVGFMLIERSIRRLPALECESCGTSLAHVRVAVLESGRCPHCDAAQFSGPVVLIDFSDDFDLDLDAETASIDEPDSRPAAPASVPVASSRIRRTVALAG
ncbi:MAG: hypothetical protein KDA25_13585 [Phycisphaerales bacterium]|nr:hypothetical protein [Phycisphaerales bacterium]